MRLQSAKEALKNLEEQNDTKYAEITRHAIQIIESERDLDPSTEVLRDEEDGVYVVIDPKNVLITSSELKQ